jgi:RNA polymerase sigma-70 factor (ECF subfamily)
MGSPTDDQSDAVLIESFLDGDEAAFRALYRRHTVRLTQVVRRVLANRTDVEDAVQDAWLAACRSLAGYRGEAQFSTWLTAIAIRVAVRRLNLPARVERELSEDVTAAIASRPHDAIDLERALARLGQSQREVVRLHDVEGLTHEEIGRTLGIAPGTSRSLLTRARSALRRLLHQEMKV